ncbi:MAG: MXAN_6577-like cysteine-rich protein, partial [Myxococcota bacterium]
MNIDISLRRGLLLACTTLLLALSGCGDEGCPTGFESCDGLCTNTNANRLNCGACGVSCGAGEICNAGVCETSCPDGQEACDGSCVISLSDVANCGGCGNACADGEVCMAGSCSAQCAIGFANCGGSCRDLDNDSTNCGGCGASCGVGARCVEGTCTPTCGPTQIDCGGVCSDIDNDTANCGACGTVCAAGEICDGGDCTLFCVEGLTACPDGTCRDLDADPNNCGGCSAPCPVGDACVAGVCTQTCTGATPDLCGDSCVDLQSNPSFCGDCATECPAGAVCSEGVCQLTCAPGLTDCGGACVDLTSDPTNCNACGTVCTAPAAGGVPACAAGVCTAVCPAGTADCNGDLAEMGTDGCEVTPATDLMNCGACGNVCDAPNATDSCVDGACGIATCDLGFGDCDRVAATGCETDLDTDDVNCGACGTVCTLTEECTDGVCTPIALAGDTCADALTITDGTQTLAWTALGADVFLTAPSACSTTSLTGPDIVFAYTATANTTVDVEMGVPASNRYSAIVTTTCADEETAITCDSDFSPPEVTVSFAVTAGETYYVWLRDTTSGSAALPNPIDVTVRSPATGPILGLNAAPVGSCTPGMGGLVGAGPVTEFTTGPSEFPFWGMADETSSALGGYFYYGDTFGTWRVRKDGTQTTSDDVERLAALSSLNQGYNALAIGSNIFTLDDTSSRTSTHLYRISTNNGATWGPVTAVSGSIPTSPDTGSDATDALTNEGNIVYLVSEETTASRTVRTEIYSLDASGTLPATVSFLGDFNPDYDCNGITLDSTYFYLTCAGLDRVIRVNRSSFAVDLVTADIDLSTTNNAIFAVDTTSPPDGLADALYIKGNQDALHLVCSPGGATLPAPTGAFYRYGNGTGDEGMAFDEADGRIYMVEGGTS